MSTQWYYIFAGLVTVFSVARLSRLLVIDKFPPIKSVRDRYENKTDGSGWQILTMCGYCMGVWTAAFVVGTGLAAGVYDPTSMAAYDIWARIWWVFNGTMAASYAGAIVMAYDGDLNDEG